MRQVLKGSTNISVDVYIIDSADGTPETGVLFNTAGMDMEYRREGAAVVDITEATLAALTTAHTDGGFLEIGKGLYRLDVPDAAFATGADTVSIQGTVTGMIVLPQTIQLVDFDPNDAVRMGLTALPSAVPAANGGLPTVDASNRIVGIQGTKNDLDDLNDLSAAQMNTEIDNGLDTAIPGSPTANSINERVAAIDDKLPAGNISDFDESADLVRLSAAGIDDILDEAITEPTGPFTWAGASLRSIIGWVGALARNKMTQTSTTHTLRDDADAANIATATVSDAAGTATRDEWV